MVDIKRKLNPVGIDVVIDQFQTKMSTLFNSIDWVMYPRIYPNPKKVSLRSKVPEFFDDFEYLETFMDDRYPLTTFFLVSSERPFNDGIFKADISLVCQVSDLKSIFPSIPHRADEEFNRTIINKLRIMYEYKGMTTEIQNVYKEFDKEEVRLDDMNSFYVVRFNFTVDYYYNC